MFKRKTVIFLKGKDNKIISEFNENITILYLKIYIRDRINSKNFDLYHKGKIVENNNIPLYKFFKSKTDKIIKLHLKTKINSDSISSELRTNYNGNNNIYTNQIKNKNKEKLKLMEEEIPISKEKIKNKELINNKNKNKTNINGCLMKKNKIKKKYNSLENLLLKQEREIRLLKNEINEVNIKYRTLKNKSVEKENKIKKNIFQFTESNDNFAIISKYPKPKRCLSIESFNTNYLIKKNIKDNQEEKSINLTNDNMHSNAFNIDSTSFNSNNNSNPLEIFTTNISDINNNNRNNNNNFDISKNNDLNKNSRNEKAKNKIINNNLNDKEDDNLAYYSNKNNLNKYKYQIKEYNTNSNEPNNNIINTSKITQDSTDNNSNKEEDKLNYNIIIKEFKVNSIKQLLSKDILESKYSLKMPDSYNKYYTIFKYLSNKEIFSFNLTNKSNYICSLIYWLNYLENKILFLNDNLNKLAEKYNKLTEEIDTVESKSNSILSHFSKSGLKVLNSPHYLDIYNNPTEYFTKDNIFLFIYKMLFLFNNLYDEKNNLSDNDFITFMVNEIKIKTKDNKSLKEYIYNLLDKEVDFSFDNVIKAKKIMNFYKIENIEGNRLSKIDRASTIIGYVIRDLMGFTGLSNKAAGGGRKSSSGLAQNKNSNIKVDKDISYNNLKNRIINVCEKFGDENNKCQNMILKIKELIVKYYN